MTGFAIRLTLALAATAFLPASIQGQNTAPPQLAPWVGFRVTTTDSTVLFPAWVEHETADELGLRTRCRDCQSIVSLPWHDIARIDRPDRHPTWKSALVGGGTGLLIGVIAGSINYSTARCAPTEDFCDLANGLAIPILGGLGLLAGTAVGLVVGTRTWRQVWPTTR